MILRNCRSRFSAGGWTKYAGQAHPVGSPARMVGTFARRGASCAHPWFCVRPRNMAYTQRYVREQSGATKTAEGGCLPAYLELYEYGRGGLAAKPKGVSIVS